MFRAGWEFGVVGSGFGGGFGSGEFERLASRCVVCGLWGLDCEFLEEREELKLTFVGVWGPLPAAGEGFMLLLKLCVDWGRSEWTFLQREDLCWVWGEMSSMRVKQRRYDYWSQARKKEKLN